MILILFCFVFCSFLYLFLFTLYITFLIFLFTISTHNNMKKEKALEIKPLVFLTLSFNQMQEQIFQSLIWILAFFSLLFYLTFILIFQVLWKTFFTKWDYSLFLLFNFYCLFLPQLAISISIGISLYILDSSNSILTLSFFLSPDWFIKDNIFCRIFTNISIFFTGFITTPLAWECRSRMAWHIETFIDTFVTCAYKVVIP